MEMSKMGHASQGEHSTNLVAPTSSQREKFLLDHTKLFRIV